MKKKMLIFLCLFSAIVPCLIFGSKLKADASISSSTTYIYFNCFDTKETTIIKLRDLFDEFAGDDTQLFYTGDVGSNYYFYHFNDLYRIEYDDYTLFSSSFTNNNGWNPLYSGCGLPVTMVSVPSFLQSATSLISDTSFDSSSDLYQDGYNAGYNTGLDVGTKNGYSSGYNDGLEKGTQDGYNAGYNDGYTTAGNVAINGKTIFISSIVLQAKSKGNNSVYYSKIYSGDDLRALRSGGTIFFDTINRQIESWLDTDEDYISNFDIIINFNQDLSFSDTYFGVWSSNYVEYTFYNNSIMQLQNEFENTGKYILDFSETLSDKVFNKLVFNVSSFDYSIFTFYDSQNNYYAAYNEGYYDGLEQLEPKLDKSYDDGYSFGYNTGYNEGYKVGVLDENPITLQSLFWTIAATPFETFKTIWNFEFLGFNIAHFFTGFLMVFLAIFIIKRIL